MFDAAVLSQRLRYVVDRGRNAVYQELGYFARRAFLEQFGPLPQHVEGASYSGFDVPARLLALAPAAWLDYCMVTEEATDSDALGRSLKNSADTLARFLNLPNETNRAAELRFGLRKDDSVVSELFHFETTWQDPLFIADDETYREFRSHPHPIYNPERPRNQQVCPATKLVLRRIWPAMVDLAVATPQVFDYDLGMTDNRGVS